MSDVLLEQLIREVTSLRKRVAALETAEVIPSRLQASDGDPNPALWANANGYIGILTTGQKSDLQIKDILNISQTLADAAGTLNIARNAYYDGSWKRTIADADASLLQFASDESFRFYQATDANDTADSAITWTERFRIVAGGAIKVGSLAGAGSRTVVAAADGTLSAP